MSGKPAAYEKRDSSLAQRFPINEASHNPTARFQYCGSHSAPRTRALCTAHIPGSLAIGTPGASRFHSETNPDLSAVRRN